MTTCGESMSGLCLCECVGRLRFLIRLLPHSILFSVNMAPFGIRVMCIEPGFFRTNVADPKLLKKSLDELWSRLPQDVRDEYTQDYIDTCE